MTRQNEFVTETPIGIAMQNGQYDRMASHNYILAGCAAKTSGSIIELGCGHNSTPLLHAICCPDLIHPEGRRIVSIDTYPDWVEQFSMFRTPWHELICTRDITPYLDEPWDIVLVDCEKELRVPWAEQLRRYAQLVIFHDIEDETSYNYERILPTFSYRADFKTYTPWTSVVSDYSLPEWLVRLAEGYNGRA